MENSQGESLIRLLDDPDQLVYEAVSLKIQQLGTEFLPDLESAARKAMSPVLHERIEHIIKLLQHNQLKSDFQIWVHGPSPRLIDGAWLMSRYQFPDLTLEQFSRLIKPLKDEIWLEISDTLTAIEKIRVLNMLFFLRNRFYLNESHPDSPGNNFINRMIETGKANEHSMSLIYAILAQELGMPVFVVEMPGHPILAYLDVPVVQEEPLDPALFDVLFYINPTDGGSLHSKKDITNLLNRLSVPVDLKYFKPRTNTWFIRSCMIRLSLDYKRSGSEIRSSQVEELITLWK